MKGNFIESMEAVGTVVMCGFTLVGSLIVLTYGICMLCTLSANMGGLVLGMGSMVALAVAAVKLMEKIASFFAHKKAAKIVIVIAMGIFALISAIAATTYAICMAFAVVADVSNLILGLGGIVPLVETVVKFVTGVFIAGLLVYAYARVIE